MQFQNAWYNLVQLVQIYNYSCYNFRTIDGMLEKLEQLIYFSQLLVQFWISWHSFLTDFVTSYSSHNFTTGISYPVSLVFVGNSSNLSQR